MNEACNLECCIDKTGRLDFVMRAKWYIEGLLTADEDGKTFQLRVLTTQDYFVFY